MNVTILIHQQRFSTLLIILFIVNLKCINFRSMSPVGRDQICSTNFVQSIWFKILFLQSTCFFNQLGQPIIGSKKIHLVQYIWFDSLDESIRFDFGLIRWGQPSRYNQCFKPLVSSTSDSTGFNLESNHLAQPSTVHSTDP